jgi:hypothetical protein
LVEKQGAILETIIQLATHDFLPALGISGAILILLAVAWFVPEVRFYALIAAGLIFTHSAVAVKAAWWQRAQDKQILQQEISHAIQKGQKGRADALKKFNENRLPEDWFRLEK